MGEINQLPSDASPDAKGDHTQPDAEGNPPLSLVALTQEAASINTPPDRGSGSELLLPHVEAVPGKDVDLRDVDLRGVPTKDALLRELDKIPDGSWKDHAETAIKALRPEDLQVIGDLSAALKEYRLNKVRIDGILSLYQRDPKGLSTLKELTETLWRPDYNNMKRVILPREYFTANRTYSGILSVYSSGDNPDESAGDKDTPIYTFKTHIAPS